MAKFFTKPFFIAVYLWIFLGIVLYLLADLLVMPYIAGKFKGTVKVPALVGVSPKNAEQNLLSLRLKYMLDTTGEYSSHVAAGLVLSQFPEAQTEVKEGRRVWVKVSKGFQSVKVPILKGLSLRQAEITLQQMGLNLGRVKRVKHPSIPGGAVIGSAPGPNITVEKGGKVHINLSEGEDPPNSSSTMPRLIGLSLDRAKSQLQRLNLPIGKISYKKQKKSLPNTVLSHSPPAGRELKGQSVDLVISK